MATANLLLMCSPKITAPKPYILCRHPSRFRLISSYTSPTSFSTRPLSLRVSWKHGAASSRLLKEHKGFGGNMNCADFWGPLSVWDEVGQTDKKFLCRSVEDRSVAMTEDVLAIFTCVLRKQHLIVLSISMKDFFLASPLTQRLSSKSMKIYFMVLLNFAYTLMNIWYSWNYRKVMQSFGKVRNRKPSKKQSITFHDDVEGLDAAKAELLEIVSRIKGDSEYMKVEEKVPRGVLLGGLPGTGKTLLACAVAGEADVAFISISASELVEVYGAAHVRDVFWEARKRSPSIIFIDEIDAVGLELGISFNSERDHVLNQLLTEMDGFEKGENVVVIAATNRPELLDSALKRPGRFSRTVIVGKPDGGGSHEGQTSRLLLHV